MLGLHIDEVVQPSVSCPFTTTANHIESISTANDATHFVNCRGSVVVRDSFFDGMLDDALNVHGLYARIDRVDPTGLLVRDMHPGAKGQAIYRKGDQVAVMDKKLLIPTKTMTVSEVVPINADVTYLKVVESTEGVLPDMTLEELCGSPEVLFENNTVQHNQIGNKNPFTNSHLNLKYLKLLQIQQV